MTDCLCIQEGSSIYPGECPNPNQDQCDSDLITFLVLSFFTTFFEFINDTTVPLVVLRAVDPSLKPLSMGVYWIFIKVIGYLPAPLIGGYLIDLACIGIYSFIILFYVVDTCTL